MFVVCALKFIVHEYIYVCNFVPLITFMGYMFVICRVVDHKYDIIYLVLGSPREFRRNNELIFQDYKREIPYFHPKF
jgi:hypothetical protein